MIFSSSIRLFPRSLSFRLFSRALSSSSSYPPTVLFPSPLASSDVFDSSAPLLTHSFIVSPPPSSHDGTLIWLHSTNEPIDQIKSLCFASHFPRLRFVVPRAPLIPISAFNEEEMRCWFDLLDAKFHRGMEEDFSGLEEMKERVHELLAHEASLIGDEKKVFLGGFGQGGAMALYAGIQYNKQLGGIIGLSSYLPISSILSTRLSQANKLSDILTIHGSLDDAIPLDFAISSYSSISSFLRSFEHRKIFDLAHEFRQKEFVMIQNWIQAKLKTINKNK
jgi:phospholipase/carboxylesterase